MRLDEAAVSQLQAGGDEIRPRDAAERCGREMRPRCPLPPVQAVVEDEYPQLLRAELGAMHAAKLGLATWDQASRRRAARSRALVTRP